MSIILKLFLFFEFYVFSVFQNKNKESNPYGILDTNLTILRSTGAFCALM